MMSQLPKILVVDDEPNIRRMLRVSLPESEFEVIEAASGKEGVSAVATHNPDVAIFDLGLPDLDGVECIKEIRQWSNVPIIVLSARGEEAVKIQALDQGAHDYVTKPFSVPELIARIRVALRLQASAGPNAPSIFETADLSINFATREVIVRGEVIHLTPLEYKLLCLLARNNGRVLTHKQILCDVWGAAYAGQNHYLRVLMKALRHKIEPDPAQPLWLLTETGVGYRLRANP